MSKPELDALEQRYREARGDIRAWLPLSVVRAIEDVPALIAEVRRLRDDLDAAAYRAGVAQGRIGQLQAQIEQLETLLDEVRALVGPENESGMISASAIFHTIGTSNQGDGR